MKPLGENIRKVRDLLGLHQKDIALKLNMTAQAYGKIERNETHLDVERLQQIAEAMNVTPEFISNFDEKKIFVNSQVNQISTNNDGLQYNYSQNEALIEALERTISAQQDEIKYLREQLAVLIQNKG
jgi:transcriptional regulator with XRE-family HTH domain